MSPVDFSAEVLCCPETHQDLEPMDSEELAALNEAIRRGEVRADDEQVIERILDAGLRRADGAYVYPVRRGIPNLLLSDRICWPQQ